MVCIDFSDRDTLANLSLEQAYLDTIQALVSKQPITIHSSGSTGKPKAFTFTYEQLMVSAQKTNSFFGIQQNSHLVLPLNPNFVASKLMIARAYLAKATLCIVKPSRSLDFSGIEQIDLIAMTPMQYMYSTASLVKTKVKQILLGGASAVSCDFKSLDKYTQVYESYGMTETLTHIALKQLHPERQAYFTPLDGISLSTSVNNEAIIHYPELQTTPIETTDIIDLKETGEFRWEGRSDFTINTGGIKIQPETIERHISQYFTPNICVVDLPDSVLGSCIVLIIEGEQTLDLDSILWDKYHKPKHVFHLDELVYTTNGKLQRKQTKEKLLQSLGKLNTDGADS